jgi:hypothetical protein
MELTGAITTSRYGERSDLNERFLLVVCISLTGVPFIAGLDIMAQAGGRVEP